MLSLAAIALAVAQPEGPAAPAEADGHFECDATNTEAGWMSVHSTLYADGRPFSTSGSWNGPVEAGATHFAIYWQFMRAEDRPYSAYVTITVPLRRKVSGTRLLTLARTANLNAGHMTLASPAFVDGRSAMATADLETLMDYADGGPDLVWRLVRLESYDVAIESGWLGVKRLQDALARFESLLDELNAKRADFRKRCTWENGPVPEDAEI